ncbi:MAG: hypothetical protein AAB666_02525 [Patescibacteria group bacterium]
MEEKQMLEYFASKQDLLDLKVELEDKMTKHRDEILTVLDQQTAILRRMDDERVFTFAHIQKLEKRLEEDEADIRTIKMRLAIV